MDKLIQLLKPLSALVFPDKVLPKYLYPSAGSSYAVQTYFLIPENRIPGVVAGEYYYHPIHHALQRTPSRVNPALFSIDFKLFLPAIEPLYGEDALRFGYLEMGHILFCLEKVLPVIESDYKIEILNVRDHNYHLLLTVHFDTEELTPVKPFIRKTLLIHERGSFRQGERIFDLKQQSIVMQASETGQLLSKAHSLLVFEGEKNPENYIQAGFEAQAISEHCSERGIGSCCVGILPYDPAIYALAIGGMDPSMEKAIESPLQALPLERQINAHLKHHLPDYMLPEIYIPLSQIPLTPNGKVDYQALPLPDLTVEGDYCPPKTPLEKTLVEIWESLLKIDCVGIHDDFFRLGGNSILAIKVVHRLISETGKHIKVADLFKHRTIATLSNLLSEDVAYVVIPKTEQPIAPLSFAQERLWFIEKYEQGTNAYHIPLCLKLDDTTDLEALKTSLQSLVARHEILRTVYFQDEEGIHYQRITHHILSFEETPLEEFSLQIRLSETINRYFNLEKELPIRVAIFHTPSTHYVLIVIHHIAFDGWSSAIFIKELNQFYNYYTQRIPLELYNLPIQYKDFAIWQRKYFQRERLETSIQYWQEKLKGMEPLAFPIDYSRPAQITYEGDLISFTIDEEDSLKLRNLAKECQVSLYTLLLSGFYILISKYTGQHDIVIGTPVAHRQHPQIEHLLGFFVNTLVIRHSISSLSTARALIQDLHTTLLEVQMHQDVPFEKLVDFLGIERDSSRHPLFQIMFRVQDFTNPSQFEIYETEKFLKTSKFDLDLLINDKDRELKGQLTYSTSLFKKKTAEKIVQHYTHLLCQLTTGIEKCVKDYQILTPEDYYRIIYEWNKTDSAYPKDKTVYQLFEEQVLLTPETIAVVFEEQALTYTQLNAKANQLAHYLRLQRTIQPNTLIALCLDRSIEMLIGLLAIMKAGAAYVPLDPQYPIDRLHYILKDTNAAFVLTQSYLMEKLCLHRVPPVIIIDSACYQQESPLNLPTQNKGSDLAYTIYTSGTTGNPKGVMISHDSVCNYIYSVKNYFRHIENVDFSTELAFDLSVTTTLVPLALGKRIYIYGDQLTQIDHYVQHLNKNKIDFIKSTPSFLSQIPFEKGSHKVKGCFVGGEKSTTKQLRYLLQHIDCVYDEYGPTEATVGTALHLCQMEGNHIGKPYSNYKVYVLDKQGHPVPIGAIGELYIGGKGLAHGYLNLPELTAEKFVPNHFATSEDITQGYTRLYQTGDLVRWLEDGNLEYIGRNDSQVKIRGYRIELGDIESALTSITGIQQACVNVYEQNRQQYLVGYFVADNACTIKEKALLGELSEKLPNYMLPSVLIKLERFPLTLNGKLDRKALPPPNFISDEPYLAPTNPLERHLCNIWQEVLNLEKVGTTDDFFRIGGNSILAIQISHRMNQVLENKITVSSLFKHKNIANILQSMHTLKGITYSTLTPLSQTESRHKPCLFLIHGVGGNILSFYKILPLLEDHYNIYGVHSRHLDDGSSYFENYHEMIQEYTKNIESLLTKQNSSNYTIIGWSYGVGVALEIISSLNKKYRCHQAFLIDGSPVSDQKHTAAKVNLTTPSLTENLKNLLFFFKETFGLKDTLHARTQEELFLYAHQLLGYSYQEEDLTKIKNRVLVALYNVRNLLSYSKEKPSIYSAEQFHIIHAQETNYTFKNWKGVLNSKCIHIHALPGDHWSIMTSSKLRDYFTREMIDNHVSQC